MTRRSVARRTLLLASCFLLAGCLTLTMWEKRDRSDLVSFPEREGRQPSRISTEWVNNFVGLVLTPFTLVFDIVTFPVQIFGGYYPYGEKRW